MCTQVEMLTKELSYLLVHLSVVRPIETRKFIAVSRQYLQTEVRRVAAWLRGAARRRGLVPWGRGWFSC